MLRGRRHAKVGRPSKASCCATFETRAGGGGGMGSMLRKRASEVPRLSVSLPNPDKAGHVPLVGFHVSHHLAPSFFTISGLLSPG